MAERIVSPGVFTREKDLSFLPQGVAEIGAVLIGQTIKGPAFVPTRVESFNEFQQKFGGLTEDSYLPYTAQSYLQDAPNATIVRVLGTDGYTFTKPLVLNISSSQGNRVAAVLYPSLSGSIPSFTGDLFQASFVRNLVGGATTNVTASSFGLILSGSAFTGNNTTTSSLNPTSANYFRKTFGYLPKSSKQAYTYLNFNTFQSASFATNEVVLVQTASFATFDFSEEYSVASTPFIKSQKIGGTAVNLFKFHTLSHGNSTNYEIKVGIRDIKTAADVPGSDYGTFTVVVRRVDLEEFNNVNLDPNSPNYIKRVIGDKYITVDASGKLSTNGDYNNNSVYIRVEVDSDVDAAAIDSSLLPFGFGAVTSPIPSTAGTVPSPTYVASQSLAGSYNKNVYLGYSFDFVTTDNLNFLNPLPDASTTFLNPLPDASTTTVGSDFDLATCESNSTTISLTDSATTAQLDARKFMIPFQGGFDGFQPNRKVLVGNDIVAGNTQGLDCSSATAAGTVALRKAINAVSNPDEFDMNMIVIPGVINRLHSSVTTYAKDLCEDRGDTFFVMDAGAWSDNISTVVNSLSSFDSNYVATYHPWVKILDTDKNKPVWVPPSVVLPGVIAFNDQVAAEWYAPAGLNRGGLSNVIEVKTRLTHDERDQLYVGRVNPIATFPGQGATVFGQKTLQAKPSALDRINVRRLLIAVKKFIASSSRYLVFENNTAATRNRFLSIVNPYLESIQQRNGLYAFRVIMDESNNTPDVIDRNILKGDIFLQPAKTAEFIVLDFSVLPTGAAFPEG